MCAERAARARSKRVGDVRITIRSRSCLSGMTLSWCKLCLEGTDFSLPSFVPGAIIGVWFVPLFSDRGTLGADFI